MAKFVTNSTGDMAVRKEQVKALSINLDPAVEGETPRPVSYNLRVHFTQGAGFDPMVFETDTTLVGIQGKAAAVLAALEA
jgi:hypothetical protein